ncbi:hypothetical protein [Nostoc sp. C117]|uniref:hypothetical protein n=1 Tax=Nostoc sp. C117 TaxID=3349875 RepID=UPI00370D0D59
MNRNSQTFRKYAEFFGAICGGLLISLPAIPQVIAQESTPKLNPSPSIFSEPPYNRSKVPVPPEPGARPPRSIPPTEGETRPVPPEPGARPPRSIPPTEGETRPVPPEPGARPPRPIPPTEGETRPVPPGPGATLPVEPRQRPSATIALTNNRVNIRLVNDTAANITYQVIGDTAPRSLQGKSDVTLQSLSAPITVTFEREDGGQLIVTPQSSSEPGNLQVKFNEATNATQGRSTMRIEKNGSVFLN